MNLARLAPDQQDRLAELLRLQVGGETLPAFIRRVSPRLPPPRHMRPVYELLHRARRRPVRALISMPPRHVKTTTIQHAFAWWLARAPADTCAYASYSSEQAESKSPRVAKLAALAGVDLDGDIQKRSEWRTQQGGGLLSVGVGGGLTGKGVTGLAVVDDPYKNRVEADSRTIREQRLEWLHEVAETRLEGTASLFVVHTRWHPDDMIGVLARTGDWEIVNLPAIAEPDDLLGRAVGEALWPARFPIDVLLRLQRALGPWSFDALYQGRPRPRGAKLYGPPHYYDPDDLQTHGMRIGIGGDPNASDDTAADFGVLGAGWIDGRDADTRRLYLREVEREQSTVPAYAHRTRAFQERHGDAEAAIEGYGPGKSVVATIKAVDPHARVREINTPGDKFQRQQGSAAAWNQGRIMVPMYKNGRSPPWVKVLVDELAEVTGVGDETDDQADMLATLWNAIDTEPAGFQRSARVVRKRRV